MGGGVTGPEKWVGGGLGQPPSTLRENLGLPLCPLPRHMWMWFLLLSSQYKLWTDCNPQLLSFLACKKGSLWEMWWLWRVKKGVYPKRWINTNRPARKGFNLDERNGPSVCWCFWRGKIQNTAKSTINGRRQWPHASKLKKVQGVCEISGRDLITPEHKREGSRLKTSTASVVSPNWCGYLPSYQSNQDEQSETMIFKLGYTTHQFGVINFNLLKQPKRLKP